MNEEYNDPNTYDFDFESNNDEEFDPENDPVLNAFMEKLAEAKEKYDSIPKMLIPNPEKLKEFIKSFKLLTKVVKSEDINAKITYQLNDGLGGSKPSIKIVTDIFTIMDINNFMLSLKTAYSIEACSIGNNLIQIDIGFNNIYDTFIEKPQI